MKHIRENVSVFENRCLCGNSDNVDFFNNSWKNRVPVCYHVKLHKYELHNVIDISAV